MKEAAIIYRKEKSRPLTEYQKRINEVAQEICYIINFIVMSVQLHKGFMQLL